MLSVRALAAMSRAKSRCGWSAGSVLTYSDSARAWFTFTGRRVGAVFSPAAPGRVAAGCCAETEPKVDNAATTADRKAGRASLNGCFIIDILRQPSVRRDGDAGVQPGARDADSQNYHTRCVPLEHASLAGARGGDHRRYARCRVSARHRHPAECGEGGVPC